MWLISITLEILTYSDNMHMPSWRASFEDGSSLRPQIQLSGCALKRKDENDFLPIRPWKNHLSLTYHLKIQIQKTIIVNATNKQTSIPKFHPGKCPKTPRRLAPEQPFSCTHLTQPATPQNGLDRSRSATKPISKRADVTPNFTSSLPPVHISRTWKQGVVMTGERRVCYSVKEGSHEQGWCSRSMHEKEVWNVSGMQQKKNGF